MFLYVTLASFVSQNERLYSDYSFSLVICLFGAFFLLPAVGAGGHYRIRHSLLRISPFSLKFWPAVVFFYSFCLSAFYL